jgi:hypothetical protein
MEATPQKRDINELLTTGYFKTTRGKSPSGFVLASSLSRLANVSFAELLPRPTLTHSSQPLTMPPASAVKVETEALADDCLRLPGLSQKTS